MAKVHFYFEGDGQIVWADTDEAILKQLTVYLKAEEAFAPEARVQNPSFERMTRTKRALAQALHDAIEHETTRSLEKDHYYQLFTHLRHRGEQAILVLKSKYLNHWQQLSAWGLDVVGEKEKARVRKPVSDEDWQHFFAQYVAHERTLPPDEQVADIDLDQFERDQQQLEQHRKYWMQA